MINLIIDSGYSSIKCSYKDECKKIPSSISFQYRTGMTAGESINSHVFEGQEYVIGEGSTDEETFATTDFKFKYKFEPLIIKHVRDVFGISDKEEPEVLLSLALSDWDKKDQLIQRCLSYEVDGVKIKNKVQVIPQGIGVYYDYISSNKNYHPSTTYVIDIGYNTINVIYLQDGKPIRNKSKGYPSHGVSSIIRPFTNYLESTFSLPFSEQEAVRIFMTNKFTYNGEVQPQVCETIATYRKQFITKLFHSILVQDKKLITTSERVIIAGGGCHFLKGTDFPPNVELVTDPYEFSNLRGMIYAVKVGNK